MAFLTLTLVSETVSKADRICLCLQALNSTFFRFHEGMLGDAFALAKLMAFMLGQSPR